MIKIREFTEPIRNVPASSIVRLGNRIVKFHGLESREFGTTVVQKARISDNEGNQFTLEASYPVHFVSSIVEYDALSYRT